MADGEKFVYTNISSFNDSLVSDRPSVARHREQKRVAILCVVLRVVVEREVVGGKGPAHKPKKRRKMVGWRLAWQTDLV